MRIGIDINPLAHSFQDGTKRYISELIKNLALIDKKDNFILFSPKKVAIPRQKNFKLVVIPRFPILKRQFFLSYFAHIEKLDVFHQPDPYGSGFLTCKKVITTIHDTNLGMVYPTSSLKYITKLYLSKLVRRFVLRKTTKFIFVSRFTQREFQTLFKNFTKKKWVTIYEGVSPSFVKSPTKAGKKNYILTLGDFSPRKNVVTILKAFKLLPKKMAAEFYMLIVASTNEAAKKITKLALDLGIKHKIKVVVNPSDTQVARFYQEAMVFTFPSLYEGFGLPILEAMRCGCPVITSNFGAMKEIAGQAGYLTNTRSTKKLAQALIKLLKNKKLRERLIQKGLIRSGEFSWKAMAQETLQTYFQT